MALITRYQPRMEPRLVGFPYQIDAVEELKDLEYGAVFHEQGLGKTKIAIDLALSWLERDLVDSVLFLTKKSLVQNWKEEIKAHSYLTPKALTQSRDDNFLALNSPSRFFLSHYEVCISEQKRLALFQKTRRLGVICDEAQKFKNPDSRLAKALFALSKGFARRAILTGTPIANRPQDIWALIYFLDHGESLGPSFRDFKRDLELTADLAINTARRRDFEAALADLFGRIRPFAIRETKKSAGITLPTKTIQNVAVDPEDRQKELYAAYRDELRAIVVRQGIPALDQADELLKRLLRLVQVASNPRLIDDSYAERPGKLDVLDSLLVDALERGYAEKLIVWTNFTENADWLTRHLRPYGAVRVHGKMAIEDRNRSVARFKSERDVRILVATPGAAKEGLTLTVANTAVFFDRGFSLDDYLQAQDRIHRISQTKECFVFNLVMRNSVDEWVDELLAIKRHAAQLGLGDISKEEYRQSASYAFAETLERILGPLSEAHA